MTDEQLNEWAALQNADAGRLRASQMEAVEAMRAKCEAIARSLIGFSAGRVADAIAALKDKP